jgi:hypothetical protein
VAARYWRRLASRLAKWITGPGQSPHCARDGESHLAEHFGAGLVTTAHDFGRMGTRPSHPELLDWLANEFVVRRLPA